MIFFKFRVSVESRFFCRFFFLVSFLKCIIESCVFVMLFIVIRKMKFSNIFGFRLFFFIGERMLFWLLFFYFFGGFVDDSIVRLGRCLNVWECVFFLSVVFTYLYLFFFRFLFRLAFWIVGCF